MKRICLLAAVIVAGKPVAAQRLNYEGGLLAASGKYLFTEGTNTVALSTGFALMAGPVTVRASFPVWFQNNRLLTSSGWGALPTGGNRAGQAVHDSSVARRLRPANETASGLPVSPPEAAITDYAVRIADPLVQVGVEVLSASRLRVTVTAAAKPPVADTADFGTGQWDAAAGAAALYQAGRYLVGVDLSYTHFGDLPAVDFRDAGAARLTFGRAPASGWAWAATVAGSTRIIPEFDPPVTVGGSVSRLGRRGVFGFSAGVGVTEMAPDFSVGAFWSIQLADLSGGSRANGAGRIASQR